MFTHSTGSPFRQLWPVAGHLKRGIRNPEQGPNQMNYNLLRTVYFGITLSALFGLSACGGGTGTTTPPGKNPVTPSLVFSANTNTITSGQSVKLSWQATNATSVTITASAGSATHTLPTTGLSGTVTDSPTQTTTYTATASNAGISSKPQSVTVQVGNDLTDDPPRGHGTAPGVRLRYRSRGFYYHIQHRSFWPGRQCKWERYRNSSIRVELERFPQHNQAGRSGDLELASEQWNCDRSFYRQCGLHVMRIAERQRHGFSGSYNDLYGHGNSSGRSKHHAIHHGDGGLWQHGSH